MDGTEKTMRLLFDFQRFDGNERLDEVIRSVEYTDIGIPLEDGELQVNAAGETDNRRVKTGGFEE